MRDVLEFSGHPMDRGWIPHKPETWPYRFARIKNPLVMKHWIGRERGVDQFREVRLVAGDQVKIVMVSRMGDVGITEDLKADNGYGARVMLEDLYDWTEAT